MAYYNQEEQEYIRYILENGYKIYKTVKDYNKLSDKNKYRLFVCLK